MIEAVKTPTPEEQDARMSEVINLVMHRNGLRLGKDDPLLIIHTLQDVFCWLKVHCYSSNKIIN